MRYCASQTAPFVDARHLAASGSVPEVLRTLVHNDKVICDSVAIIHYLDEQFPNPQLIPATPELQEEMTNWINLQNDFPM